MSPISYGVGASSVCRCVVAHKQFLDLLAFVSGNCDVFDSSMFLVLKLATFVSEDWVLQVFARCYSIVMLTTV